MWTCWRNTVVRMFLSSSVAVLESIRNGQQMALTCGANACCMSALNNGNWNSNHLSYKLIINYTAESRVGNTFLYVKGESNASWLQQSRSPGECLRAQKNYTEDGCVTLSVEALLKIPAASPRIYAPIRDGTSNVHICALAVWCMGLWIPFWHVQPFFEFWALCLDGLLGMTQMQFMNN